MYESHHELLTNVQDVVLLRPEITPSSKPAVTLLMENQLHQGGCLHYCMAS